VSPAGGKRPGAGRPRVYTEGTVSRSLSLDPLADDALREHVEREGVSRSRAASVLILLGAEKKAAKK